MKFEEITFRKIKLEAAFDWEGSSATLEQILRATADRDCCRRAVEMTSFLLMQRLKKQRRSSNVAFKLWWTAFFSRHDAAQYLEEATNLGDEIRLYDSQYDVFNAAYQADYSVETEELAPLNTFAQLVEALRLAMEQHDHLSSVSIQAHRSTSPLFEENKNAENVAADSTAKADSSDMVLQ